MGRSKKCSRAALFADVQGFLSRPSWLRTRKYHCKNSRTIRGLPNVQRRNQFHLQSLYDGSVPIFSGEVCCISSSEAARFFQEQSSNEHIKGSTMYLYNVITVPCPCHPMFGCLEDTNGHQCTANVAPTFANLLLSEALNRL